MMRVLAIALLLLAACDRNSGRDEPSVEAKLALLSFEGADYKTEAAKIAHGERLSWILGCSGCHGADFLGRNVSKDNPDLGDMNAPNLTLLLTDYSDAELDRAIRHGVPKDGRDLWWMPPENFQFLSDADFAALIAYLRTFKPAGEKMPPIRKGPEFERLVREEGLEPAVPTVARFRRERPVDLGDRHALGRYIAMTTCSECHNSKLQGYEEFTPDLIVAGAYTREEFERLITQGIPAGERKLKDDLMEQVAKERFLRLTPRERGALYAYLKARAETLQ